MVALSKLALVSAVALLGWAYQATRPPRPAILGAPGGPPITSPRIQLKDGRYLAYREEGVRRENARFRVIFFHGFSSTKESGFPVSKELVDELGIYMLLFDRAGYGDSDANPKRSLKSDATDVEELADALRLGDKFYVVGCSMGGYPAWSCLNYIPHRSVNQGYGSQLAHHHLRPGGRDQLVCIGGSRRGAEGAAAPLVGQIIKEQAGRSGSGCAGGELLVAAACQRVEDRVREARRPGPQDLLDRAPRAVAAPRLARAEVVPGVADRQGRARRVHRQGLGDPHRALEEAARERPAGSGTGQSNAAGDLRVTVPRREDPVRHVGVRSHGDQEPVPRRGGRRQHLAGVQGQDRPSGDPAVRGAEAAVGAVPRAPRGRARAPGHGRGRGQDHQGALARRGAARLAVAERAAPGWLKLNKTGKGW